MRDRSALLLGFVPFILLIGLTSSTWFAGMFAGFATAIGGAVKDAPYEGFSARKFFRSPGIGTIVGITLNVVFPLPVVVVFLATIGGERLITESYKIIRNQKPGKFDFGEWGNRR